MNQALRNVLLLEGESVNQNEDARVADAPDKRAPERHSRCLSAY